MIEKNETDSISTESGVEHDRVTTVNSNNITRSTTVHPANWKQLPTVSTPDVRQTTPIIPATDRTNEPGDSERITTPRSPDHCISKSPSLSKVRRTTPHIDINDLSADFVSLSNAINIFDLSKGTHVTAEIVISEKLSKTTQSGEAILYKCRLAGKIEEYVIKIFTRKFEEDEIDAKQKIIQALKGTSCVAQVIRTGKYAGFYYEVSLYYHNGSLADRLKQKRFSESEIRKDILPKLNESICQIHQANVIHSDIKPANILYTEDKKDLVLIDFGVARYTDGRKLVTQAGRTLDYSAPELFHGKVAKESDYYSLGVSIFELFEGKTPTALDEEKNIASSMHVLNHGRIRRPNGMSDNLYALLLQLTYPFFGTEESTEDFPLYTRWGYLQVNKWLTVSHIPKNILEAIIQPYTQSASPNKGANHGAVLSFPYRNSLYTSLNALILAMANSNVSDAYRYIMADTSSFGEILRNYKKSDDPEIRHLADELLKRHKEFKEKVPKSIPNDEKVILFYYTFSDNLDTLFTTFFKPIKANRLDDLGKEFLDILTRTDWEEKIQTYMSLLEHGILYSYLSQRKQDELTPTERHLSQLLESLSAISRTDKQTAYCAMAYAFSGRNTPFRHGKYVFRNLQDLTEKITDCEKETEKLFSMISPLLTNAHHLSHEFAGWLINQDIPYSNISF